MGFGWDMEAMVVIIETGDRQMEINYAVLSTFMCFTLFVIQVCLFVFVLF